MIEAKGMSPCLKVWVKTQAQSGKDSALWVHNLLSALNTFTSTLSRQDLDTLGFESQAVAFKWCGLWPVTHPPQASVSVLLKQKQLQHMAVVRTKQEQR